jgi:phosphopantetheine adenylyltransferase
VNIAIGGLETIFLLANDQYVLTSSTFVKQIFELGGGDVERVKRLVPDNVALRLAEKLGGRGSLRRAKSVRRSS